MLIEGVGDIVTYIGSTDVYQGLKKLYYDGLAYLEKRAEAEKKAENMAENILKSTDTVRFAPPEVKGICLYVLSERFFLSREESQEKAIIKILDLCQTKAEYRKILRRIHPTGKKGKFKDGLARLEAIVDWKEASQLRALNRKFAYSPSSSFSSSLSNLLNIDNYPDLPNIMQPIEPRIQYA